MTRVLVLDPSLFTLPYDRALCGGLAAAGCDVTLVGRALRPAERGPADAALPLAAHFYRATETRLVWPGRSHKLAKSAEHVVDMARLPVLCDRLQPDIIHVQWLALPLVDRHFLAALRRRAPLVMTVHNSVPFHGAAASRLQLLGAGSLHDRFDRLIAHTPTTRQHLLDEGIAPRRIALVPHGLLPLADAAAPAPAEERVCRVLFFGEIKPYKGLRLLIDAIAALPPATRARLRLHVAGRPRMEMAPLIQACHTLGFADQVTWDLRFIRNEALADLFAACDVVVLPYHDVDSSGVLTLATSAGKAVVASEIGGFRDLLASGETALLAPLEPAGFAQALGRLVEDDALRRRLGDNLRRHGTDAIPSWSAIGRATVDIYADAIAAWRAERAGHYVRSPSPIGRGSG
jgi:glycosyltransferase involved in cell wall biosynthesis